MAVALFQRAFRVVAIEDGVHETADRPDDRYRPVLQGDHLRESTWFEQTWHNNHVGSRIHQVG